MTGTQYISEGKRGQENMKFSITAAKTVDFYYTAISRAYKGWPIKRNYPVSCIALWDNKLLMLQI